MRVLFDFFINIARWACAVENKRDFPYNSALSWDSVRGPNYLICLTKPAEPVVLLVATGKVRKLATRIGKERNNGKF